MKRCPAEPCENCMWWRTYKLENIQTGEVKFETMCALELLLVKLPELIVSVDGCQRAANEARNAVWGVAAGMAAHGFTAPIRALQTKVGERICESLEGEEKEQICLKSKI